MNVTLEDGTRFEGITVAERVDQEADDQYQRSRTVLNFDRLEVNQAMRLPDDLKVPLRLVEQTGRGGGAWREPPKAKAVDESDPMDPVFRRFGTVAQIESVE